jgi:hypothetical protein
MWPFSFAPENGRISVPSLLDIFSNIVRNAFTTVSVEKFYNPASGLTQCAFASQQLNLNSCCANGSSSACNQPWYLDRTLSAIGHLASHQGSISLQDLVQQLVANRPVCMRMPAPPALVTIASQARSGSYEVSLLRFSAIAALALWLKPDSGGADILYPLAPAPAPLEADKPYSEEEFLAAIKPLAQQRAQSRGPIAP